MEIIIKKEKLHQEESEGGGKIVDYSFYSEIFEDSEIEIIFHFGEVQISFKQDVFEQENRIYYSISKAEYLKSVGINRPELYNLRNISEVGVNKSLIEKVRIFKQGNKNIPAKMRA